jgi:HTH-type transcriptional regulator/antitoxin HigA
MANIQDYYKIVEDSISELGVDPNSCRDDNELGAWALMRGDQEVWIDCWYVEDEDQDYFQVLERLDVIFDSKIGSPEGDELEVLGILIDQYEKEHFPIEFPDPIEAIKFRMEQSGYNQRDLAGIIGLKSRASEILNKKRKLSLDMIRRLSSGWNIPTDVLIQAY